MELPNPFTNDGSLPTTPWVRREVGGIYVGRNKQVWMYRELPLAPLQWEDPQRRLEVGRKLEGLLEEIGEKSKDIGQGLRMLSRNRTIHIVSVSYETVLTAPEGTPDRLRPFMDDILDPTVRSKTLLVGVQLQSSTIAQVTKARGGPLQKLRAAAASATEDTEGSLDPFRDDYLAMDSIFRRHETVEPRTEALEQLEAWFNHGSTTDAPIAFRPSSLRVLNGREYEISAVMGFTTTQMRAPSAQWLLDAATHPDPAVAISIRAELEPATVTRTRLRRQRRKLIAADEEEAATGDIGREENRSNLSMAEHLESYVRQQRTAWLTETSILMAREVSTADSTYADMLKDVYGIDSKPLENRQLEALSEMLPTSPVRVNPFPQDINPAMIAYGGLAAFSNLGDDTGVFMGNVDPDYVPTWLDPFGASRNNLPPVMGVFGDPGSGKSLSVDARVLTPDGWKRMGDIQVDDPVVGRDGKTYNVTGVFPQGVMPLYRVTFNDGSSVEATDDHLWAVATSGRLAEGLGWQVRTTAELRERVLDGQGKPQWRIPVVDPIYRPEADLPLDPYLLGVLLGDGSFSNRWASFTTADPEIVESVSSLIPQDHTVRFRSRHTYGIVKPAGRLRNDVMTALRELALMGCTSEKKFIPQAYLWGSIAQRFSLLQGLMDTDGDIGKRGAVVFNTSSPALADHVRELVQSLGGTVRTTRVPTYTYKGERLRGRLAYRLHLCLPNDFGAPFRLPRKAERWRPRSTYTPARSIAEITYTRDAEAQCIAVSSPDRLYVTDEHIVTHNTFACQLLAGQAAIAGVSAIFINPKSADSLAPWAHWVASMGVPVQIVSMSKMEEQGGAFDPFRFCAPQMAAEVLTRHIQTVIGYALTPKQNILLKEGLTRGAMSGARCAAEALEFVNDPEVIELVKLSADSSTLFALAYGRVPQEPWTNQGGLTLIEFDRELPLPKGGKSPESYEPSEREGLAAMRLVTRAAVEILMRAGGGVLVADEAHHFLGSEEGLSTLDRLAREGRSMGLLPVFATQRVTDLLQVDMETFMSRVLVMKLNDEAEAAAALRLCRLEATDDRLEFLRQAGPRRGGKGVPSRSALGIFRDLYDRHAVIQIGPIPEHVRLAMSTNRDDRELRAQQEADEAEPTSASPEKGETGFGWPTQQHGDAHGDSFADQNHLEENEQ